MQKTDFQANKVALVSGGHFVHDVFSSFLAPFLPLLINKFGLTMLLAGAFSVFFRLPSFFNPLLGILSDRVDIRRIAIWAPATTAVAMSVLGLAPSYAVVCILLLIAGTSSAIFHVLGPVMIARVAGVYTGRAMSFWMTGGELARTVGPLVAVWAVSLWEFEGSYPVMIPGIATSIFLCLVYRRAMRPSTEPQRQAESLRETWAALRKVMLPLTGIIVARAFMGATLVIFLPTYMVAAGKSLWFGGASLAAMECAGVFGTLLGGTLSDRIGRTPVLFSAMPLSCLLMLSFVYAPGWLTFPILILLGCTVFAITPVNLAIVQDNAGGRRGSANGMFMGISFIATAGVTLFVGWLSDLIGLQMAFTVSALLGLSGIPAIFFIPKSQHRVSENDER